MTELLTGALSDAEQKVVSIPSKEKKPADYTVSRKVKNSNPVKKPVLNIDTLNDFLVRRNISVRYNVIAKDVLLDIPGHEGTIDNYDECGRAVILSELIKEDFQKLNYLDTFLLPIADRPGNLYNPAAKWVLSKEWDGKDRLPELFRTITAKNEEAKEAFMFRWLVTGIAALFEKNGISAAGMLVLQGSQNIGKTFWFRKLFSDEVRDKVFHDGIALDPRNKDDVSNVNRNWLCELGELDSTITKSKVSDLKAFITRPNDVFRPPYARKMKEFPRRTFLCGTVNSPYFLYDQTGNRRFWTIECEKINSYHTIDMQQVWAQVYWNNYKQGEKWSLTPAESALVNEINESFQMMDRPSDKVMRFYDWNLPLCDWKTSGEIAEEMGLTNITRNDLISIGLTIIRMGGVRGGRTRIGFKLKVPPRMQV